MEILRVANVFVGVQYGGENKMRFHSAPPPHPDLGLTVRSDMFPIVFILNPVSFGLGSFHFPMMKKMA